VIQGFPGHNVGQGTEAILVMTSARERSPVMTSAGERIARVSLPGSSALSKAQTCVNKIGEADTGMLW
jgi:hypothetical protein